MENNMTFEEFCKEVAERLPEYCDGLDRSQVVLKNVTKANDTKLTGICVKKEGFNISPAFYLERSFDEYQNGMSVNDVMMELRDTVEKELSKITQDFDVSFVNTFDSAKERLSCKLINGKANAEYLKDKPSEKFHDLAVVYILKVDAPGHGDENVIDSIAVTNSLMDSWGVTKEDLHSAMMENLAKEEISVKTLRGTLMEMGTAFLGETLPEISEPEISEPYVLTNKNAIFGAIAILRDDIMQKISEKMGGDYWIIPSSVHECLIMPKTFGTLHELNDMVRSVNATEVKQEEQLSDHVYEYNSVDKRVVNPMEADGRSNEQILDMNTPEAAAVRRHRAR